MKLTDQLVHVADTFAGATLRSRVTVSTMVLNHGTRLDMYASGQYSPSVRTFERAMQWFSDNWPELVDWPVDVPRPAMTEKVNNTCQAGA